MRNVSSGPAKDISFEFSAPVESSDGFVVSDLPYFKDGLDFLAPDADGTVTCYWDRLEDLLPFLKEKGLEGGISVTTRYRDLAGEHYETEWTLNPSIYKDHRYVQHRGMDDLVERVAKLEDALKGFRRVWTGPSPGATEARVTEGCAAGRKARSDVAFPDSENELAAVFRARSSSPVRA